MKYQLGHRILRKILLVPQVSVKCKQCVKSPVAQKLQQLTVLLSVPTFVDYCEELMFRKIKF